MGKVMPLFNTTQAFATPLGLVLSGTMGEYVGISNYFSACGLAIIVVSAYVRFLAPKLDKMAKA